MCSLVMSLFSCNYILKIKLLTRVQYSRCAWFLDGRTSILVYHASYNTVVLYSRDRYEIIGLLKISHSIKQPCSSVWLKKVLQMHQKC